MPVLAVVLHHVPQNGLVADRDHRLGDALGVLANARAQSAAKQDDFHERSFSWIDDGCLGDRNDEFGAPLGRRGASG